MDAWTEHNKAQGILIENFGYKHSTQAYKKLQKDWAIENPGTTLPPINTVNCNKLMKSIGCFDLSSTPMSATFSNLNRGIRQLMATDFGLVFRSTLARKRNREDVEEPGIPVRSVSLSKFEELAELLDELATIALQLAGDVEEALEADAEEDGEDEANPDIAEKFQEMAEFCDGLQDSLGSKLERIFFSRKCNLDVK